MVSDPGAVQPHPRSLASKYLVPRSWSWNFVERGPGFLGGVESRTISGDPLRVSLLCQFDLYLATCGTLRMVHHTKQAETELRIQRRTYCSFVGEGSISVFSSSLF